MHSSQVIMLLLCVMYFTTLVGLKTSLLCLLVSHWTWTAVSWMKVLCFLTRLSIPDNLLVLTFHKMLHRLTTNVYIRRSKQLSFFQSVWSYFGLGLGVSCGPSLPWGKSSAKYLLYVLYQLLLLSWHSMLRLLVKWQMFSCCLSYRCHLL